MKVEGSSQPKQEAVHAQDFFSTLKLTKFSHTIKMGSQSTSSKSAFTNHDFSVLNHLSGGL